MLLSSIVLIFFGIGFLLSTELDWVHQVASGVLSLSILLGALSLLKYPRVLDQIGTLKGILLTTLAVHLGLILGVGLFDHSSQMFWVVDSHSIHVPGSERVMGLIKWADGGTRSSIYDRTYLAHILGGIFFTIFGVNQIASGLALLVAKLGAVLLVFRLGTDLFGNQVARFGTLLYTFLPTALFYTTTFYKEATVQLLVLLGSYSIVRFYRKPNFKFFFFLVLAVGFLGNERHYLAPCFVVSLLILTFGSQQLTWKIKGLLLGVLYSGYLAFDSYYYDIGFRDLFKSLRIYRDNYMAFSDVSLINKELPYPLAVIKLFFSPYFTFGKLESYSGLATLITWGGFLYQFVALAFLGSIFYLLKVKKIVMETVLLIVPLAVFLAVFGYVAPYNGRLRDSFLGVICLFGAFGILKISDRFSEKY